MNYPSDPTKGAPADGQQTAAYYLGIVLSEVRTLTAAVGTLSESVRAMTAELARMKDGASKSREQRAEMMSLCRSVSKENIVVRFIKWLVDTGKTTEGIRSLLVVLGILIAACATIAVLGPTLVQVWSGVH